MRKLTHLSLCSRVSGIELEEKESKMEYVGKLGSLFDGAGTFPFAALQFGIEPSWASEIESFPVSVTKKRFPNMVHLGDITKINGSEIAPVDFITFGSPCQDLSVAGKQAIIRTVA